MKFFGLSLMSPSALMGALVYYDAPAPPNIGGGDTVGTSTVGAVTVTTELIQGSWTERTGTATGPSVKSFGANILQGNRVGTAAPYTPAVMTLTLSGLESDATYGSVRIYYIGKEGGAEDWNIAYSFPGGAGSIVDHEGVAVDNSNGGVGVAVAPSGDVRYYHEVANFMTDGSGEVTFTLSQALADTNQRIAIDGIGFESVPVPEPGLTGLLLAACGLSLRRRR
ncbi:MAG: PEP-CTERM sorting domain-containing protein [Verrucomicrobiales bacterium]